MQPIAPHLGSVRTPPPHTHVHTSASHRRRQDFDIRKLTVSPCSPAVSAACGAPLWPHTGCCYGATPSRQPAASEDATDAVGARSSTSSKSWSLAMCVSRTVSRPECTRCAHEASRMDCSRNSCFDSKAPATQPDPDSAQHDRSPHRQSACRPTRSRASASALSQSAYPQSPDAGPPSSA